MTWDGVERRCNNKKDEEVTPCVRLVIIESLTASMISKVDEIHKCLIGNGHPGLKTDVALLQQKEIERTKHWFAVYTAIAALACKTLWDLFTK
jgi:hypothetical protein